MEFVIDDKMKFVMLDAKDAFMSLSEKEKQYAHYLSRASWYGSLICMVQTSVESVLLFILFQRVFRDYPLDELHQLPARLESVASESEVTSFFTYIGAFYGNMGNYKSFGDSKFIPNLPVETFESILKAIAKAWDDDCDKYWKFSQKSLYSLSKRENQIGLGPDKGISTYYSSNCTEEDAMKIQQFFDERNILANNTRLFKTGNNNYEIRLASALSHPKEEFQEDLIDFLGDHSVQLANEETPMQIKVTRGDYSALLQACVENLTLAKTVTANEKETAMLDDYITSFISGSMRAHQRGSEHWVRNEKPAVETYIGFIETYRDPYGSRGEFEGFVAIVDKEMSKKYAYLVEQSMQIMRHLPIDPIYHKDRFLSPDYSALHVLTFANNGIPAGINIPNYDYIRQSIGFKNVSLHNVLSARVEDDRVSFIDDDHQALYKKNMNPSFEVQVALHELLGHGSGKLFTESSDHSNNIPSDNTLNKFTDRPIKETYYRIGETYDSKFSTIASAYEECRAEAIGVYLSLFEDVLAILGHADKTKQVEITYINWLLMARSGLTALEYYSPETKTWRQSHCQARFAIFRVLLEHGGPDLINVELFTSILDNKSDLTIYLSEKAITTIGKRVIGEFIDHLQVFKSTGDAESARNYFNTLTQVDSPLLLSYRDIVISRKKPRQLFIQCNTTLTNMSSVTVTQYPPTPQGMIKSFIDRFQDTQEIQYRLDDAITKDLTNSVYDY